MQSIHFALLSLKLRFKELKDQERGATMVEYGLMVALVAIALIVAIGAMTGALRGVFGDIQTALQNAT